MQIHFLFQSGTVFSAKKSCFVVYTALSMDQAKHCPLSDHIPLTLTRHAGISVLSNSTSDLECH